MYIAHSLGSWKKQTPVSLYSFRNEGSRSCWKRTSIFFSCIFHDKLPITVWYIDVKKEEKWCLYDVEAWLFLISLLVIPNLSPSLTSLEFFTLKLLFDPWHFFCRGVAFLFFFKKKRQMFIKFHVFLSLLSHLSRYTIQPEIHFSWDSS